MTTINLTAREAEQLRCLIAQAKRRLNEELEAWPSLDMMVNQKFISRLYDKINTAYEAAVVEEYKPSTTT